MAIGLGCEDGGSKPIRDIAAAVEASGGDIWASLKLLSRWRVFLRARAP